MARVITENGTQDLNEVNHGFPVYFESKKIAVDSLLAFLRTTPSIDYGHVIKVKEGGRYLTVFKNY